MPTPFYHLSLALELLDAPGLPEATRRFLQARRGAFLFGNTAPDVQVVSGQPREDTHFFSIPIQAGDQAPWERLLVEHPHLVAAKKNSPDRASFIAGYLCHLQADWIWIRQIFAPVFGPGCAWGTFYDRLYYHNVLRAYLDQRIMPSLGTGMDACLRQVSSDSWLPFVKSRYLVDWREFLCKQLQPGAPTKTVEVFSFRQGISAPEYYALLASEERMQDEVFNHLPLERVQLYRLRVVEENARLLSTFLALALHPSSSGRSRDLAQGAHP